jgi:hypothetical protein
MPKRWATGLYPEITSVLSEHPATPQLNSNFGVQSFHDTTNGSVRHADAQTMPKAAARESGITAYLQFGGTANSDGQVYALSPSVGYDFSSHFGIAVGAPIYFIRPSSSIGSTSASGLGDPFLGFHLRYPNEIINFATFLSGTAPVGNSKEGLSTGRAKSH